MSSLLGSWGTWIAETASSAAKVATETVHEIIAEGKQELSSASNNNNNNNTTSTASPSSKKSSLPYCYWEVVSVPSFTVVDDQQPNSTAVVFPSTSKFWSSNPMQWACLIKNGVARDVNTFVISPEALIFESHYNSNSKSKTTSSTSESEKTKEENNKEDDDDDDDDLFEKIDGEEKEETPQPRLCFNDEEGNIKTMIENIIVKKNFKIEMKEKSTTSSSSNHASLYTIDIPISILPTADSIRKMLKEDSLLADLRYDLVPKWVKENDFWRNFAFRVYLLSQTESVEDAIKILEIINVEHRHVVVTQQHPKQQEEESNQKNQNRNEKQQTAEFLQRLVEMSKTGDVIIKNFEQAHQQRFHSNRSLTKKGYGKLGEAANVQQEIFLKELTENIQATGETESWQKLFSTRAAKELESVHSSVSMLEKLIAEVDEYLQQKTQVDDKHNNNNSISLPSLELIQSIAESCKFHKGRIGAFIGELQSAPSERVSGDKEFDPDEGVLTSSLKKANEKLGAVLIQQAIALRKLTDFAIKNSFHHHEDDSDEGQKTKKKKNRDDDTGNNNKNDHEVLDDEQQKKNFHHRISNKTIDGGNNDDSEFVAKMPWEDDEE